MTASTQDAQDQAPESVRKLGGRVSQAGDYANPHQHRQRASPQAIEDRNQQEDFALSLCEGGVAG